MHSSRFALALSVLLGVVGYTLGQYIIYDIKTQAMCREVTRGPTRDCRWVAGLNMADLVVEGGRIAAYKIRWFSGKWSGWYVPGLNDLSEKYNSYARRTCALPYRKNSLRRRWAVFYDHTHTFILCTPK